MISGGIKEDAAAKEARGSEDFWEPSAYCCSLLAFDPRLNSKQFLVRVL